jgi:hypothetical protein
MIDTLLRRIKICCHSSTLSTMDVEAERIAGNTWARKAAKKRSTVNVRSLLLAAAVALGLASAGLGANYDDLIRQGYRWVPSMAH